MVFHLARGLGQAVGPMGACLALAALYAAGRVDGVVAGDGVRSSESSLTRSLGYVAWVCSLPRRAGRVVRELAWRG